MISLYRDPEGKFVLNQANNSVQTNGTSENLVSGDATTQMKVRIAKLETLLKVSSQVCIEGECLRQLCSHAE